MFYPFMAFSHRLRHRACAARTAVVRVFDSLSGKWILAIAYNVSRVIVVADSTVGWKCDKPRSSPV